MLSGVHALNLYKIMKKIKNTDLLGKKVQPIVKWDYYTDPDHLTGGAHHYVDDDT